MAFCVDAGSRFLSDDGLHIEAGAGDIDATVKCSALIKPSSCNLTVFISEKDVHYNNSFINSLSVNKVLFNKIFSIYLFIY